MSYSAQTRDRFRLAVAAVTGVTTVAALSATGWVAGAAAHDSQALRQEQAAAARAKYRAELEAWRKATAERAEAGAPDQQPRPRVELRPRPQRTEVTWRYVQGTATTSTVGTGGQVSAVPASSGGQQSAPPPPAPPPPPPPPAPPAPAPAPSSGS